MNYHGDDQNNQRGRGYNQHGRQRQTRNVPPKVWSGHKFNHQYESQQNDD